MPEDTGPGEGDAGITRRIRAGETASEAVLRAIAAMRDEDSRRVDPPLYRSIDPDALDNIFRGRRLERTNGLVRFSHAGCIVTISSDGTVRAERAVPETGLSFDYDSTAGSAMGSE